MANPVFANGHALIIGTGTDVKGSTSSQYESTLNDADWMAEVLKHPSLCAYPPNQVKVLRGPQATRENIEKELNGLKERVWDIDDSQDCTVVVFFSGHGMRDVRDSNKCYLIPYGYRPGQELATHAIDGKFLYEKLDAIKGRVVLLLNACHAGGVMSALDGGDKDIVLGSEPLTAKQMKYLSEGKGFFILSAVQAANKAYTAFSARLGVRKKYSPFTIGLSRGFAGKVKNTNDGYVRCLDLLTACTAFVGSRTRMEQLPVGDIRGDNFPVGCYTSGGLFQFPLLGDDDLKLELEDGDEEGPEGARRNVPTTQVTYNYTGNFTANGSIYNERLTFGDHANFGVTNNNVITYKY